MRPLQPCELSVSPPHRNSIVRIDEVVVRIGEDRRSLLAIEPLWLRRTSSRTSRYSRTARGASSGSMAFTQSACALEFILHPLRSGWHRPRSHDRRRDLRKCNGRRRLQRPDATGRCPGLAERFGSGMIGHLAVQMRKTTDTPFRWTSSHRRRSDAHAT